MVVDKQHIATHVGCHGIVDFAKPSSVRSVVNGIKSGVVDNSPVLHVAGLSSPAVQQGSNTDSAVEFQFKHPVMLAGIWLQVTSNMKVYNYDVTTGLNRPYCGEISQDKIIYNLNKCIGDDTKAAARQSLNCIKNKNKIKYGEKPFSIWRMEFLHPAMWHDRDIDFAR